MVEGFVLIGLRVATFDAKPRTRNRAFLFLTFRNLGLWTSHNREKGRRREVGKAG